VFVTEASQRFHVPTVWIRAVMRAESFGAVHAISPKGAMGLMQIMPATWAELRQRYRLGASNVSRTMRLTAVVRWIAFG
jgi:soluble lytic murein transglycosylase-like protein